MSVSVTHKFTSAKSNGTDTTLVQPTNWNDQHNLTLNSGNLLGRVSVGNGQAEEIPFSSYSATVLAQTNAAGWLSTIGAFASAGGTLSGAVTISSGGLTVTAGGVTLTAGDLTLSSGALHVSGAVSGGAASFTSVTASASGSFGAGLGVTGALTVSGTIAASGAISSSAGASFANPVTAPNTATGGARYSGGVLSSFGVSLTLVTGGAHQFSCTSTPNHNLAIATLESTSVFGYVIVQWLDATDFVVRTFNNAGTLTPIPFSVVIY